MADDMEGEIFADVENRMKKAVEVLERELAGVRSGRASPALVERLNVEYYGTNVPLNQLASIHVPEPRLLAIQPWDKGAIASIQKAIQRSELSLTPSNDGTLIRIAIPPLTEERRREIVRLVHSRVEGGRVAIRNCRRDAHDDLRDLLREKMISEDAFKRAEERLQALTDRAIAEAQRVGQAKEAEVLEV